MLIKLANFQLEKLFCGLKCTLLTHVRRMCLSAALMPSRAYLGLNFAGLLSVRVGSISTTPF